MGKMKNKRSTGRHKYNPIGCAPGTQIETELTLLPVAGSIKSLMLKLQSESEAERECTCNTIASITEQEGAVEQLLKAGLVRAIGPQLIPSNKLSLKESALGALRNLSVEGGVSGCEEMVTQDVMTPLMTFFKQFEWDSNNKDKILVESQRNTFEQALHLLRNVCEASETAMSLFNSNNLYQFILPCLNPECHGENVCHAAAECLYAASDSNPALATVMSDPQVRGQLEALLASAHSTPKQLLIRTVAAGILYNSGSCEVLPGIISMLSVLLDRDICGLLLTLDALSTTIKERESAPSIPDEEDDGMPCDDCTANPTEMLAKKSEINYGVLDVQVEATSHVLQAHLIALQLIANMCCTQEEEEEEEDGSDEWDGSTEEEVMEGEEGVIDSSLIPTEIHAAFMEHGIPDKVLSKTLLPAEDVCSRLAAHSNTQSLFTSVGEVEVLAMLCLGNLLNGIDSSQLVGGGDTAAAQHIVQLWERLAVMATTDRVCSNSELLEAVTNVMHKAVQKLAQLSPAKLSALTVGDVEFLYKLSSSSSPAIRANIIRIVAAIAVPLSKLQPIHPMMKAIGEFLLQFVRIESEAWLVAECVDAIMDMFAEDHLAALIQEIALLQKLTALLPHFKTLIKQQKSSLGEHKPIVMTVKSNLPRFIHYWSSQ